MKEQDLKWGKHLEDHLHKKMEEVELVMSDMGKGSKTYLKRKGDDGQFEYSICTKKRNGDLQYVFKAGFPSAVSTSEGDTTPATVSPISSSRAAAFRHRSTQDSEDNKSTDNDEEEEQDMNQKISTQLPDYDPVAESLPPKANNQPGSPIDMCKMCNTPECKKHKFHRFLEMFTLPFYNGEFNKEEAKLKRLYGMAYHIVDQYELSRDNPGRPMTKADLEAPIPPCVQKSEKTWMSFLKTEYNKENNTYTINSKQLKRMRNEQNEE